MPSLELKRELEKVGTQILTSYANGLTLRELADQYNCSSGTIRNFLIEKGATLRKRGRQANKKIVNHEIPENLAPVEEPQVPGFID